MSLLLLLAALGALIPGAFVGTLLGFAVIAVFRVVDLPDWLVLFPIGGALAAAGLTIYFGWGCV